MKEKKNHIFTIFKSFVCFCTSIMIMLLIPSTSSNATISRQYFIGSKYYTANSSNLPRLPTDEFRRYTLFISPKCANGSVVDIKSDGYRNGTNCWLYQLNYSFAQQFVIECVGRDRLGEYFVIRKAKNKNMVLDVTGGKVRNGQNIQLYQYNRTRAQQWYIRKNSGGYYYIESRLNSNYVMDVNGASNRNCTNIQLWKKNGTNAQLFSFNTCKHSHRMWFSFLANDQTDMIWVAGWNCTDCHAVLSHGTWTLPN